MSTNGNTVEIVEEEYVVEADEDNVYLSIPVANNSEYSSYEVQVSWSVSAGLDAVGSGTQNVNIGPGGGRIVNVTESHSAEGGTEVTACVQTDIVGSGGGGL